MHRKMSERDVSRRMEIFRMRRTKGMQVTLGQSTCAIATVKPTPQPV
jgi:hypothetical protein